jgi:hypothetical protein
MRFYGVWANSRTKTRTKRPRKTLRITYGNCRALPTRIHFLNTVSPTPTPTPDGTGITRPRCRGSSKNGGWIVRRMGISTPRTRPASPVPYRPTDAEVSNRPKRHR